MLEEDSEQLAEQKRKIVYNQYVTMAKQLAYQNEQMGCGETDWEVILKDLIGK
jgi:hypothetical protein